ncbi:S-methyl-5-thioribose-1-phosphate isomerase [Crossiella sp. CA-258035]|uniref:S-methyl-5-thioribose-1-phosphate isomerase n=1 Tax=Crossiella sp. CA-258035 TaxID=2981138 RepID=UPI0024BC609C|nr:S-methyl-5-thioribose-1-phosphate isomerase [Crossiella sp. CA-258035]WHT20918.1 S-methyl-5-thioribose-1-phosphate isomerase [Crossiella sp. CA-258035]
MTYTLGWDDGVVVAIDQRVLPHELRWLRLATVEEVIEAIATLAVRGAPAIGLAGAFGVALSAHLHTDHAVVRTDAERLAQARPTAVNLAWGVRRALERLPEGKQAVLAEALAMLAEDEATNRTAARQAADLVLSLTPDRPLRVLTHCNTGRLATAAWGTALGAISDLAGRGRVEEVLVDETRPLLQGARLTAWELAEQGIPHRLLVDSAAAAAMSLGQVDVVLVGADRITARGDVANKIGTYGLAVSAARHRIPFIVVAPESTVDETLAHGSQIVVEERAAEEVTAFGGTPVAPAGVAVFNPAFDVTPAELVSAVVTERRVWRPNHGTALAGRLTSAIGEGLDLSGVYTDPALFGAAAGALAEEFRGSFDAVLGLASGGLLLGAALARHAEVPLVLPGNPVAPGTRVLVVDEVLGDRLGDAAELVWGSGGTVAGFGVLVVEQGTDPEKLAPHKVVALAEVAS